MLDVGAVDVEVRLTTAMDVEVRLTTAMDVSLLDESIDRSNAIIL